jgi:hypothetical protein
LEAVGHHGKLLFTTGYRMTFAQIEEESDWTTGPTYKVLNRTNASLITKESSTSMKNVPFQETCKPTSTAHSGQFSASYRAPDNAKPTEPASSEVRTKK